MKSTQKISIASKCHSFIAVCAAATAWHFGGLASFAQTFTPLYSFTGGHDGANPYGNLVQASDGNLYGTTYAGGTNNVGSVFRITTNGVLTPLYSFTNGHDGAYPQSGLVQAGDGNLYGTTTGGGTNGDGVVFRITTNGALTPLWSFTGGHDGGSPSAGLVLASDGNLYGTTYVGGTNGYGGVYRITTGGVLTPLYSFADGHDGAYPQSGLMQASDGNLYGTTPVGGASGVGVAFGMTTNGVLISLYSFNGGGDGSSSKAGLVQASDGNLYGTAVSGGANSDGTVFRMNFAITALHPFTGINDGSNPQAGVVQASDGNLYGTAVSGGANGDGGVFRMTTSGAFTLLHSFTDGHDGANPFGGLMQASDGNLYGTATYGGTNGDGTVFKLTLPPPPAPPSLDIASSGNESVLFWPGSNTNYVLQSTTNVASTNWVTVSNAAPIAGFTVTNSLPAQFFRLAIP